MTEPDDTTSTHHPSQVRVLTAASCSAAVTVKHPAVAADTPAAELDSRRGWASVGALALGAFVIVMTETLPVGLLPQLADGLDVSLGPAGLTVLVPGFSAAVAAPLFYMGSGRFDRRSLILVLGLAVLVSNVVVAVAPSFVLVLAARLVFGATLGAFWTVVSPVGPKLVGPAAGTRAITIIAAGISGGMVVGLPAGQFLGNVLGWRLTFSIAAVATLIVVVIQALVLPSIPSGGRTHAHDLVDVVKRPAARFGMAAGAVAFTGQIAAWTYITPALVENTDLSSDGISLLYVIYGVGGIVGSIIAGSLFRRGVIGSFARAAAVVAVTLIALAFAGTGALLTGVLLVVWGLFWGIVNPGTLVWLLDSAPGSPEAASAVNVTNLQVAVGAGSGLGALLVSTTSLQTVFLTGGLIVLASAALAAVSARFVTLTPRQ
ncbi:MFS transporter [Nocardioides sp. LHG3406-4]|uniref:MFS transporter n=1 Tax=Nocardioides sp. LHG3406-4 TaxID=2804575 RepID=UPI003CEBF016